jgi:hypothetical protein
MKSRISVSVWVPVLLVLAGCGRTADFSGPAPAGAMQCALEHAIAAGYERIEGSVETGFLRMSQRLPQSPADVLPEPQPDLGRAVLRDPTALPVENHLEIRQERGTLRITVLGLNNEGARTEAGTNAEDQARTMIALCTSDPPTPPVSADEQTPLDALPPRTGGTP